MIEIDKELVKDRFSQRWDTYEDNAHVQRLIAEELILHLREFTAKDELNDVLEIGCGSGFLTKSLVDNFKVAGLYANDLCGCLEERITQVIAPNQLKGFLAGDIEDIPLPQGLDLVCSASTLQWMEDLSLLFSRICQALKRKGMFVFNTFGPNNFKEIKHISGNALNYIMLDELKRMLIRSGFEVFAYEKECVLYFDELSDVFKHLKLTGVNGFKASQMTRARYREMMVTYEREFRTDKGLRLTYHPQLFWARKR